MFFAGEGGRGMERERRPVHTLVALPRWVIQVNTGPSLVSKRDKSDMSGLGVLGSGYSRFS